MALSQRLEFRQSQALVMTPQLMQAIKLLQLSSLDLAAYVETELEKNPLLERGNDDDDGPSNAERDEAGSESASESGDAGEGDDGGASADWMGEENFDSSRSSMEQSLGTELENVFPDDGSEKSAPAEMPPPSYSEWSGTGAGGGDDYNLEAFVSAEATLADHLAEQMALTVTDPGPAHDRRNTSSTWWTRPAISPAISRAWRKSSARRSPKSRRCSTVLQTFDPPGVCARNLTECLAIQLKERDRFDPAMEALVAHLDLLAKRDFAALRRVTGRQRRGPRRHDRRDPQSQSQARRRLRLHHGAADRA